MNIDHSVLISLGTKSLQEILSDRESIAQTMQVNNIDHKQIEYKLDFCPRLH